VPLDIGEQKGKHTLEKHLNSCSILVKIKLKIKSTRFMRNFGNYLFLSIFLFLFVNSGNAQLPVADTIKTNKGNMVVQPIFHGALVLKLGDKTIYIDPYNGINAYKGIEAPDLILITHIHQDHLDTVTLNALNTSKAKFIVPQDVADRLPSKFLDKVTVLRNNEKIDLFETSIIAVPMYDLPQQSNSRHLVGKGNGYVLEYGGKRVYISGDTDDIPEMRNLKHIDIGFVCMNQPFTMTIEQAASAVLEFKPKTIYPYHYRNMNGFTDIEAFKNIINKNNANIDVRVRNWYAQILQTTKVTKVENVVYGMVSGAALTMDVYKPEKSNKIGIIVIPGTAFGYAYSANYSQPSMTANFASDLTYFAKYARILVDKGYTIFVINHRLAPQFRYNDILSDCQRAVRFIRFNAQKYNIDPNNIGAFGFSSGATLCSMLGVTDWEHNKSQTGIDSISAKVQSVVTLAARFDLSDFNKKEDTIIQNPIISRVLVNYIGELPMVENGNYILTGKYAEASPITYVDKGDASFLVYHSYDDPLAPQRQAGNMYKKLLNNGIETKFIMSKNEGHTPIPNIEEIDGWFLKHLKK
jgi:L-ascorbate metabolism protein UlaG (beta-lactamase superfamily)/acetyl esterase/lipase